MALAAIVENIEDLPEIVREHYVQKGTKWVLETEGDEAKLRLNRDLAEERKKRQELEKNLQRYGATTPEEVEALRVRRRKEDDEEETATQRVTRLRDELDRTKRDTEITLREKDAEVTRIKGELTQERIGARIRTAAQGSRDFQTSAQEDAVLLGMRVFREDETGKIAAFDPTGERMLGKSGDDLTIDEWLDQRRADRRHWFGGQQGTGNQGGGAQHQSNNANQNRARPKTRSAMSDKEKAAAVGELGIEGFMEIPE